MRKPQLKKVKDVLAEHGYCPADALRKIASKSTEEAADERYNERTRLDFMSMAIKANSELLQYVEPKLTKTQHTGELTHKVQRITRTIVDPKHTDS